MQEALDRLKTEDEPTVDEALILDYLSFAAYNVSTVVVTAK